MSGTRRSWRRGRTAVLAGCLAACLSPAGHAVGLRDAYVLALENDPAFRAAIAARAAGREHRAIGRAALLPSLSYSYGTARNASEVTRLTATDEATLERDYRSHASVLRLEQPLFDYAAWATYREGVAKSLLADARFREESQALMVRLFEAYSDTLLARERERLAAARRRAYAGRLEANRRLFDAGEGTRTAILETRARLETASARLIEAREATADALGELRAIVGRPLRADDLRPLREEAAMPPLKPDNFADWRERALAANPDLAVRRREVEVADGGVARARAGHLPSVSLYLSSRETESDTESSYDRVYDTDTVGLQVSLPLFAGGGTSARRRQAIAERGRLRHELDATRVRVIEDLRREFDRIAGARARIRAYRAAADAARALVTATQKSVAGGERINPDVLDAEQRRYAAARDLAGARHDYLRAWVALHRLAGDLGADELRVVAACFGGDTAP
ncbi:TolC family outer membrane protein [Salinisphaera sp. PC39]|uniref:TolC family outer membrane protein n=1 Tax=Salinisphaera sp. PC39 TaxID=1304156 RepID=UPI003340A56B